MTAAFVPMPAPRAGRLLCICFPAGGLRDRAGAALLGLHAAAFATSIVAQVLTFALLPLAGSLYAPSSGLGALPYAALFVGAAVATFPASFLLDAFGRRAAFALGASIGVAGGLILAWGLSRGFFPALVLGAFWLGIANGFSLFHRHAAAVADPRAIAVIVAAGGLAGVLAPTLAAAAESLAPAATFAGMAAAAATAHLASLALSFMLPPAVPAEPSPPAARTAPLRRFLLPTAVAAIAWFAMAALMGADALTLFGCGLGASAVAGGISWHVVAMYTPALLVARLAAGPRLGLVAGPALLAAAVIVLFGGDRVGSAMTSLVLVGAGWSLTTSAAAVRLYAQGPPSRWVLGGHDFAVLAAAVAGALLSVVIARAP